jgi:large subunit ribosomal protein L18
MKRININRKAKRNLRHTRITNRLRRDNNLKPRMLVTKTNKHLFVQIIDDRVGKTLASCSTLKSKQNANIAAAKTLGETIAKKAMDAKINEVVFDRGGNLYHGQVKALAEAAKATGLKF